MEGISSTISLRTTAHFFTDDQLDEIENECHRNIVDTSRDSSAEDSYLFKTKIPKLIEYKRILNKHIDRVEWNTKVQDLENRPQKTESLCQQLQ